MTRSFLLSLTLISHCALSSANLSTLDVANLISDVSKAAEYHLNVFALLSVNQVDEEIMNEFVVNASRNGDSVNGIWFSAQFQVRSNLNSHFNIMNSIHNKYRIQIVNEHISGYLKNVMIPFSIPDWHNPRPWPYWFDLPQDQDQHCPGWQCPRDPCTISQQWQVGQ